jgi:hypothetical protein
VDPALASLLGAVVGGVIGGSSSGAIEWSRAKRERRTAGESDERELRRAARLLVEELESGRRLLVRSIENDAYMWEPPRRELPAYVFAEYRAVLASQASRSDWDAVATAYREFDRLNWQVRGLIEEERHTGPLRRSELEPYSAGSNARLDQALKATDGGILCLRALMSGPSAT